MWKRLFQKKKPITLDTQGISSSSTNPVSRFVPNLPPRWQGVPYPEYKWAQVMSESESPKTRRQAAVKMGQDYRWFPQYVPVLIKLAHDPDKGVRIAAIRVLGHPERGNRATMIEALSDDHLGVRLEAIKALHSHKMDGTPLVEILRGPDRALHAQAAASLSKMWGEEVVPALIEALGSAYTTITRRKAAKSLVKQRDERAVAPLLNAIGDPNPNVRAAAARAVRLLIDRLGWGYPYRAYPDQVFKALEEGLEHPDSTVRLHAAYNLGMLGKSEGARILTEALNSVEQPPYLTRNQVREALHRIGQ